ncbi:MAG: LVIVD repeat-containing protein, partial [Candidatus Thorarchaeota archaeon]
MIGVGVLFALVLYGPWTGPDQHLTKLGQINTGGRTADVKVRGNIAFVIDQNEPTPGGLVLINVSDPANPSMLSSFHDGGWPQRLDVAGGIVYVADAQEGLEIIDVSDPTSPSEIAQYAGSGEVYDVQVIGGIAYIADWNNGLVIL